MNSLDFERCFLVRHGAYTNFPVEMLSDLGERQAQNAGRFLLEQSLQEPILLSSSKPRATQTANIISKEINSAFRPSEWINVAGNHPDGVRSLEFVINKALEEARLPTSGKELIIVGHQPLNKLALPHKKSQITTGSVFEYEIGSWHNPHCSDTMEGIFYDRLRAAGAPL